MPPALTRRCPLTRKSWCRPWWALPRLEPQCLTRIGIFYWQYVGIHLFRVLFKCNYLCWLDTKPVVRRRYRAAEMALWHDLITKLHRPDGGGGGDLDLDLDPCRHALRDSAHYDYDDGGDDLGKSSEIMDDASCWDRITAGTTPVPGRPGFPADRRRQGKSLIECRRTPLRRISRSVLNCQFIMPYRSSAH